MNHPRHAISKVLTGLREKIGAFRKISGAPLVTLPTDRRFFLAALFLVGVFLGAEAKNVSRERFAIGYWDYLLPAEGSVIDPNHLQKTFLEQGGSLALQPKTAEAAPSCARPSTR
jgi:hypothetical protein